jgi:radical SAM protein with 4Fe4S-binding SPASM domain
MLKMIKTKISNSLPPKFREQIKSIKYKTEIKFSAQRRRNLKEMTELTRKRPLILSLETSNLCNSRCVFCAYPKMIPPQKIMEKQLFEKIINEFAEWGPGFVGFDPLLADPLMDPNIFERIKFIKTNHPHLKIYVFTNAIGMKRWSDEQYEEFLSNIDQLNISIGGLEKEDYKVMFGVDRFDWVWESFAKISQIKKAQNLKLKMYCHIRTNDIGKILKSEKLKMIRNMGFTCNDTIDSFQAWGDIINQDSLPQGAKLLLNQNDVAGVTCLIPKIFITVLSNGDIVACGCRDAKRQTHMGNANEMTLEEYWTHPKLESFRSTFERKKLHPLCQNCAMYMPYDKMLSNKGMTNFKTDTNFFDALI